MAGKPRVVVVGLGPAGADLLLPAARAALERVPIRFVRTARHPAVDDLARDGIALEPLDLLYDRADDLDTVYAAIADRVVETAREQGEILYAVPGSPTIAERSVELVRAAGIDVELIPGISFVDLAWWRLGIDPMHGARVVDGRSFAIDAAGSSGSMLVAQCDSQLVCSEVKLALLESLPAEHEVTVLQRLGLADEKVFTVALEDVDRDVEPDHLTSLFIDTGRVAVGPELARLLALTERLRGPGGCPWDQAQTHHSLRRHVLEEAYEVVEAIEKLPADAPGGDIPIGAYDALEDELGDLLFQVMIQSVLASEAGAFTVADVARGVHTKLVRRHPHVFGDVRVNDASEVVTNWEQIKKGEQDDQSLVAGVTAGLPALIAAQKLFRKGASIGLEPELSLADAVQQLSGADGAAFESKLGATLAAVVAIGREHDVDAESALAGWTRHYKDRFRRMEQLAIESGVDLAGAPAAEVRKLWERGFRRAVNASEASGPVKLPGVPPQLHVPRPDEAAPADEMTMLRGWIVHLRESAIYKLEGLDADQLRWRPTPTANSLGAIVMHLGYAERQWFRAIFAAEAMDMSWLQHMFVVPDGWSVPEVVAFYRAETAAADLVLDRAPSLDEPSAAEIRKTTLRWIMTHAVEEIARHVGHMDITRELLDGRTGR